MDRTRRQLLAGLGTAGGAAVAGCTSFLPGVGGGADGQFALSTLDVGGSDGSTIPHRPAGEPALLDFFATWCPPCRPQMAELRAIDDRFSNLHMISISWEESASAIKGFWQELDGTWPVAQDTDLKIAQAYGVVGRLPTKILLDRTGEEQWRHTGLSGAASIAEKVTQVVDG
jgi:Thiol-disulfide isomerase and thioredoxins